MYLCSRCDKPFSYEPSRDRHIRYCGSRNHRRPRSCWACSYAKTKCSFGQPCSRCVRKNLECIYYGQTFKKADGLRSESQITRVIGEKSSVDTIPALTQMLSDADRENMASIVLTQTSPKTGVDNPLEHIETRLSNEFFCENQQGFSTPSLSNDIFLLPNESLFDNSMAASGKFNQQRPDWCTWAQQGLALAVISSAHSVQTSAEQNTLLAQTPAQHSAGLIVQSFRAFPIMMLRRETWPWFIHPHSHLLSKSASDALPDALSACMGIAQMYVLGTIETKRFVWQTIRAECRCFTQKMYQMSKFELLAALQACMVYLVMHIIEDSSKDDEIGLELLQVLYELYMFSKTLYNGCTSESEVLKPSSDWSTWIFAESRRRLSNLWLLVGSVICIRTNAAKDKSQSYRGIPLPCGRSLWEASSEIAWKAEYEANRMLEISGMICLGDLIDAQQLKNTATHARKLDLWNASADQLGFLLNLIPTMI